MKIEGCQKCKNKIHNPTDSIEEFCKCLCHSVVEIEQHWRNGVLVKLIINGLNYPLPDLKEKD